VRFFSFLLLFASACVQDAEAPPEAAPAPRHLRVAYAPIADCAHLFVATDLKLWEKHGLEIEEVQLASGTKILEALAASSIDVGFAGIVSILQARAAGLPFVVAGGAIVEDTEHTAHRLVVAQASPIAGAADLNGKSVALPTLKGIDQLVMTEYLHAAGLAPDAVRLREVPFPRMEGVLQSGEVDAVLAMEPYVSAAARNGTAKAVDDPYTVVAPRTLVSTWVMKADAAKGPSGEAVAATFAEAAQWIATHDAETRNIVAQHTGLDPAIVAAMPMNQMEPSPRREDIQAMIERAKKAGLLPAPPTADELLVR
jgi:NitT/TauT family transport system substrate-binding protein